MFGRYGNSESQRGESEAYQLNRPNSSTEFMETAVLAEALECLPEADIGRLKRIAAYYAAGTEWDDADLLNEAIIKALEGTRRCRKDLDIVTFLAGAMRSLCWAARRRAATDPLSRSIDLWDPDGPAAALADSTGDPEANLAARRKYKATQQNLLDLFEEDEVVLQILMGLFDAMPPEEIRATWNMDERTYDTARRRMRRKIDREFPEGFQS